MQNRLFTAEYLHFLLYILYTADANLPANVPQPLDQYVAQSVMQLDKKKKDKITNQTWKSHMTVFSSRYFLQ